MGWPTRTWASMAVGGSVDGASIAPRTTSSSPTQTPKTTDCSSSSGIACSMRSTIWSARGSSLVMTPVAASLATAVVVEVEPGDAVVPGAPLDPLSAEQATIDPPTSTDRATTVVFLIIG